MVLGKTAPSLDKDIDPLYCKVINRLIESRDSSSTDRMLPLSFSSRMLLKQSIYRENCTSRVLARTGQLPSLVMGGALPQPDCPTERGRSAFHISQSRLVLEKKRRRYLAHLLMCFLSFLSSSFMCTFAPSFYFSCAATTTSSSVHPLPPSLHTPHFIQLASLSIEGP